MKNQENKFDCYSLKKFDGIQSNDKSMMLVPFKGIL